MSNKRLNDLKDFESHMQEEYFWWWIIVRDNVAKLTKSLAAGTDLPKGFSDKANHCFSMMNTTKQHLIWVNSEIDKEISE